MKTNGMAITNEEFAQLRKGDVYFITDKNECRVFKRFAKVYRKGKFKVVNTLGHVNGILDMRWPTNDEKNRWCCPSYHAGGAASTRQNVVMPREKSTTYKENDQMSNCSAVSQALTVVKGDAIDAAWRTAAHETVKAVRAPLAAFLNKQNLPAGVVGLVLGSLDTDAGEAVLAYLVGMSMTYVPKFSRDTKLMRLATELRVLGMEHFTTKIADALLNPLREQLVEVVGSLPFGSDDK